MPTLSIIIAAYNVEDFIEKCLLSCYHPGFYNKIEILVIDDGSNDQTLQKVMRIKDSIESVNIIQQKNQGLGASRNLGINSAKGKYIWMIDGDDYIESSSIEIILENIKTDLDLYCVNYNVSDNNANVLYKAYPDNYITKILTGTEYYAINYEKNYTWQYIFRKELFLDNNIFFKERINMQDSEILPKILAHVKTVKYLDIVGYNYVQYQDSFTNSQNPEKRYQYFKSIIAVKDSLLQFGESIKNENPDLYKTIQKKIESLGQVVFNHLIYYRYKKTDFKRNINLLKEAELFPIKTKMHGRNRWIKFGINYIPEVTNFVLNFVKK